METLRKIAEAKGTCITVIEPLGNPQRLEAVLREVEAQLPRESRGELMDPLWQKARELTGEERGSLVLLRADGLTESRISEEALPTIAAVTEQFDLRLLLPVFHAAHEFYLLALSKDRTRLLHCTATSAEEVPFPKASLTEETPVSLGASKHSDKPDHLQDKMGVAGPSQGQMKGVMSGVSTEGDNEPDYMYNFFTAIDKAMLTLAKANPLPLVLVGVESELAIYRSVNTYPLLAPTGVLGSPDGYKGGEMHARGLRALSTFIPPTVEKTLNELDKLIGTGHASVHAADIVKASHEGRVAHLFLQDTAQYLGTFDEARGKVSHHGANGDGERHNLMEDATRQTILHGGNVTLLTGRQMPNGVPVCAVYRY